LYSHVVSGPPQLDIKKSKAVHVTGRGGLLSYEMLRIAHCLVNRLTDGGIGRQRYAPAALYSPETLFFASGTFFC
jgi:hypothetical protein